MQELNIVFVQLDTRISFRFVFYGEFKIEVANGGERIELSKQA